MNQLYKMRLVFIHNLSDNWNFRRNIRSKYFDYYFYDIDKVNKHIQKTREYCKSYIMKVFIESVEIL